MLPTWDFDTALRLETNDSSKKCNCTLVTEYTRLEKRKDGTDEEKPIDKRWVQVTESPVTENFFEQTSSEILFEISGHEQSD